MEDRFEDRVEQMGERFNQMEGGFKQMDERIDRMHEQMRVMMRWTAGTTALFGTIVTVLPASAAFASERRLSRQAGAGGASRTAWPA